MVELAEINKRIEGIEEKYYSLNEMPGEIFEKYHSRYQDERHKITQFLQECDVSISNLHENLLEVVDMTTKLNAVWTSPDIRGKEAFQNLIFLEGIYYNHENHSFRTPKVNFIFEFIDRESEKKILQDMLATR